MKETYCYYLFLMFYASHFHIVLVTATLVAKQYAMKSDEGVQDSVCQALVVGTFVAICGSLFILSQPDRLLGGVLAGKDYG